MFTTPAGHANVTFVAASGDSGACSGPDISFRFARRPGGWRHDADPDRERIRMALSRAGVAARAVSAARTVISVLACPIPSYQTSTLTAVGLSLRCANHARRLVQRRPQPAVSVYDSVVTAASPAGFEVGGTSAAAPAWAGLVAIADQGLATRVRVRSAPISCRPISIPYPVVLSTTSRRVSTVISPRRGTIWSPVWALPWPTSSCPTYSQPVAYRPAQPSLKPPARQHRTASRISTSSSYRPHQEVRPAA